MKRLEGQPFDQWRVRDRQVVEHYGSVGDATAGVFRVPLIGARCAFVIASTGEGWDHVSVTVDAPRCPTWDEMCAVKEAFFRRDEWVMQLHPPRTQNISLHPYCLHLWRPQYADIPLPDPTMVGPVDTLSSSRIVRA